MTGYPQLGCGKLTNKEIRFHEHAETKMRRRGISKEFALRTLENSEEVLEGKYDRKIAQKVFGEYLLRVIFEEHENYMLVITLYITKPGRYLKEKR
jgi:Mor family transcriptional regulator